VLGRENIGSKMEEIRRGWRKCSDFLPVLYIAIIIITKIT
jgi:hypothetical protein